MNKEVGETNKTIVLCGKPDAGNPHVRFDEGAGVPTCSGRSAHYKRLIIICAAAAFGWALHAFASGADLPLSATAGAYDEITIAVIETRPCDAICRTPDNPGGWIETRLGDGDEGIASRIDTCSERGTVLIVR